MAVIAPIHPGEVFLEEFLEPLGVSSIRTATVSEAWRALMPSTYAKAPWCMVIPRKVGDSGQLGPRHDRPGLIDIPWETGLVIIEGVGSSRLKLAGSGSA
jgi:hypothetical protein